MTCIRRQIASVGFWFTSALESYASICFDARELIERGHVLDNIFLEPASFYPKCICLESGKSHVSLSDMTLAAMVNCFLTRSVEP